MCTNHISTTGRKEEIKELDGRRPSDSYARLYDDILDNQKMVEAGPLCFALYCAILVYCHRHETDGRIHPSRVKALLDFSAVEIDASNPTARPFGPSSMSGDTGADPLTIAEALVEAGLLNHGNDGCYEVHDYLKHNASHAEREAARHAQREGGKRGAATRWGHGVSDGVTYDLPHSPPNSPPDGVAMPKGKGRRVKVEEVKAPPTPSLVERPRSLDAIEEPDDGLRLAIQLGEFLGQNLKALEVEECRHWLKDFAYLSPESAMQRIHEYAAKRVEQGLDPIRSVAGFRFTLRAQNDYLADQGAPKPSTQRHGHQNASTATLVGDLLS